MLEEPVKIQGLTSVVIENKAVFARIVKDIYAYENDAQIDVRLFHDDQSKVTASEILPITDIINFDINSAQTLKVIYKDLEDTISIEPDKKTNIEDKLGEAWSAINKELIHFRLSLTMQKLTLPSIFKATNIKIETDCPTLLDKVLTIIEVFKYLPKKKLLIFIGLGSYLTAQEMETTREYVQLQNASVLLLDNNSFEIYQQTVVDEDFVTMQLAHKN